MPGKLLPHHMAHAAHHYTEQQRKKREASEAERKTSTAAQSTLSSSEKELIEATRKQEREKRKADEERAEKSVHDATEAKILSGKISDSEADVKRIGKLFSYYCIDTKKRVEIFEMLPPKLRENRNVQESVIQGQNISMIPVLEEKRLLTRELALAAMEGHYYCVTQSRARRGEIWDKLPKHLQGDEEILRASVQRVGLTCIESLCCWICYHYQDEKLIEKRRESAQSHPTPLASEKEEQLIPPDPLAMS